MESKVREDDNFNFLYEVEVSLIIESVDRKWKTFERADLLEFCIAIDDVFQCHRDNDTVITIDDGSFRNYIDVRIPDEMERRRDKNYSPIPQFVLANGRTVDSITLIPIEQEIFLEPGSPQFKIFLAYKLALLENSLIKVCIEYLAEKYYGKDIDKFLSMLDFILADFASVFGNRKELLKQAFARIREENNAEKEASTKKSTPLNISEIKKGLNAEIAHNSIEELDKELDVQLEGEDALLLRKRILILFYLFKSLRNENDEEPTRTEVARILNLILGKKDVKAIGGTNTYKYLEKILTPTETTNVANLQFARAIFERLLLRQPVELIDRELKNSAGF